MLIDKLINLLQKIPFPGAVGYIKFGKTHAYYFDTIDLKHHDSDRLDDQDQNRDNIS